ncbi:MAG TPA: energy transducer TonB, partial [Acinetobacter ursingii]|nr:energy transducer TonB [Acinetobacter ursingii]
MSELIFNSHKRALLFEQYAPEASSNNIADPFTRYSLELTQPSPPRLNKVLIAIIAVASAHLGIWYIA